MGEKKNQKNVLSLYGGSSNTLRYLDIHRPEQKHHTILKSGCVQGYETINSKSLVLYVRKYGEYLDASSAQRIRQTGTTAHVHIWIRTFPS